MKPKLPFVPGSEVSGTVTEAGSAVQSLKVGDKVMQYPVRPLVYGNLFHSRLHFSFHLPCSAFRDWIGTDVPKHHLGSQYHISCWEHNRAECTGLNHGKIEIIVCNVPQCASRTILHQPAQPQLLHSHTCGFLHELLLCCCVTTFCSVFAFICMHLWLLNGHQP